MENVVESVITDGIATFTKPPLFACFSLHITPEKEENKKEAGR